MNNEIFHALAKLGTDAEGKHGINFHWLNTIWRPGRLNKQESRYKLNISTLQKGYFLEQ